MPRPRGASKIALTLPTRWIILIGEKLLTFGKVAERYAEFLQELPDFLQKMRAVFSMEEAGEYRRAARAHKAAQPAPASRPPVDFFSFNRQLNAILDTSTSVARVLRRS